MRFLIRAGFVVLSIAGLLLIWLVWLINTRTDLSEFDGLHAAPARRTVTVQFFGTSSLLFSDGQTQIMVDGWFSRPSTLTTLFGEIQPDADAIDAGLSRLGDPDVAALIAAHSHMDHAMDVAEVSKRTGALVVGSESTANIARGGGVPDSRIKIVEDGETLHFGDFTVTLIETRHFEIPEDSLWAGFETEFTVKKPLVPPASAFAYRRGKVYSIVVEHPGGSALIQASAGFKPGSLAGVRADTVFLGIGGIATQSDAYQTQWWDEVVGHTRPARIYLIHWDSFSVPLASLGEKPVAPNRLWDNFFGVRVEDSIELTLARAAIDDIEVRLLPLWRKADAYIEQSVVN